MDAGPDDFAVLIPINVDALEAFHSLCIAINREGQRYAHHARYIQLENGGEPETLGAVCKRRANCGEDAGHTARSSPSESRSFSSDATEADPENDSWQQKVLTGYYRFSLAVKPERPQTGWRVGRGRHWNNYGTGQCDLLLSDPEFPREFTQCHGVHAIFGFEKTSGLFSILAPHRNPSHTTVAGTALSLESQWFQLSRATSTIVFGKLMYRMEYVIKQEDEKYFQEGKHRFLSTYSDHELRMSSVGSTPRSDDIWIGEWRLCASIGRGTESAFQAAHTETGRMAAIKQLHRYDIASANQAQWIIDKQERLRKTLAGQRDGRYIVQQVEIMYSSRECNFQRVPFGNDHVYVFYEPLGNADFLSFMPKCSDRQLKLKMFADALRGVALLHSHGIVHRDVKHSNLAIATNKSGDTYGFVLDLQGARYLADYPTGIPTSPGHGGTIGFLAPEQEAAEGNVYGTEIDIFSLGCVGYWMFHEVYILPWGRDQARNPWRSPIKTIDDVKIRFERLHARLQLAESESIENLLFYMLQEDPKARITAQRALQHPAVAAFSNNEGDTASNKKRRVDG